jgi:hypothetical protein
LRCGSAERGRIGVAGTAYHGTVDHGSIYRDRIDVAGHGTATYGTVDHGLTGRGMHRRRIDVGTADRAGSVRSSD